jgi:molybdenum-dependent DNA-binding transcriptional regulator ModE
MHLEKLRKFIQLVERKQTGKPADVAKLLGVSERMIYNYKKFIREELNAPIAWNNFKQSYIFSESGALIWKYDDEQSIEQTDAVFNNKQLATLNRIYLGIKQSNTGSAAQFAKQLEISERSLFYYLNVLKNEFQCPLIFDKSSNNYQFKEAGNLNFKWQAK